MANKAESRRKIHLRIRSKISGSPERPRLNVFRSNKGIYAQVIDDINGKTLAAASSKSLSNFQGNKTEQATAVVDTAAQVEPEKVEAAEQAEPVTLEGEVVDRASASASVLEEEEPEAVPEPTAAQRWPHRDGHI